MISSCGFYPLHKKYLHINNQHHLLHKIEITPIPSIEGAIFYHNLCTILNRYKDRNYTSNALDEGPQYILVTNIKFAKNYTILHNNSNILRNIITISVDYKLQRKDTSKIIYQNHFVRNVSINAAITPYSNRVREQCARDNLATTSAEQVIKRIVLFLHSNNLNIHNNH